MDFSIDRELLRKALHARRQIQSPGRAATAVALNQEQPMVADGHLQIVATYKDGSEEVLVDEKNLVVSQAANIMPYMTIGLRTMSYIELGDPSPATPPDLADTSLQQTTGLRKAVSSAVNGNTVTFTAQWLDTEGNGISFTEAGLFSEPFGAGRLFARKVFTAIPKTASFSLTFNWAVAFTVVAYPGSGLLGVALCGGSTISTDYLYTAVGGESEIVVPLDFTIGGKQLDVSLNGQVLVYNQQYYEATVSATKGIKLMGFTALAGDQFYFKRTTLT